MRLILILAFAAAAYGQLPGSNQPTRIRQDQIKEPPVTKASVRITMPDGKVIYALLDPAAFVLDQTVQPPTLRILATSVQRLYLRRYALSRNADGTLTLPPGELDSIYRNGLTLTQGRDYAIAGSVVTLNDPCCEADEIINCSIWQGPTVTGQQVNP